MNREIKFRVFAYTDEGNKMVHLGPLECDNGLWFSSNEHLDDYIDKIMQFTGLKDKNGVEIYEGDIVKLFNTTVNIIYNSGGFGYISKAFDDFIYLGGNSHLKWNNNSSKLIEVIGNIYEHPKLGSQTE